MKKTMNIKEMNKTMNEYQEDEECDEVEHLESYKDTDEEFQKGKGNDDNSLDYLTMTVMTQVSIQKTLSQELCTGSRLTTKGSLSLVT